MYVPKPSPPGYGVVTNGHRDGQVHRQSWPYEAIRLSSLDQKFPPVGAILRVHYFQR